MSDVIVNQTVEEIHVTIEDDGATFIATAVDQFNIQYIHEPAPPPNVFVQANTPMASGAYIWVQTGINGNNWTIWIEDGQDQDI